MPADAVKKLLHHTPSSTEAVSTFLLNRFCIVYFLIYALRQNQRRHYEGDLTNVDIVAMRANVPQLPPETLDTFNIGHIFSYDFNSFTGVLIISFYSNLSKYIETTDLLNLQMKKKKR